MNISAKGYPGRPPIAGTVVAGGGGKRRVEIHKMKHKKFILKSGVYLRLVREGDWEYIDRLGCRGVVIILAMTADGKVLLTEQYRLPVKRSVIEYPAGLVADQRDLREESVLAAARRELLEETGYRARRVTRVTEGPSSSGSSSVILTFVRAWDLEKIHEGGGDSSESITVHEVALSRMEAWLRRKRAGGCLVDPKIYAGLYFLNKYN